MSQPRPPDAPAKRKVERLTHLGRGRWGALVDGQVRFFEETPGGLRDVTETTETLLALEFGLNWKADIRAKYDRPGRGLTAEGGLGDSPRE